MRAEHWYDFGDQAGDSNLLVQVAAHIAVLQFLRSGQSRRSPKSTGGHRPLLMMSFSRRLTLKSVMAAIARMKTNLLKDILSIQFEGEPCSGTPRNLQIVVDNFVLFVPRYGWN